MFNNTTLVVSTLLIIVLVVLYFLNKARKKRQFKEVPQNYSDSLPGNFKSSQQGEEELEQLKVTLQRVIEGEVANNSDGTLGYKEQLNKSVIENNFEDQNTLLNAVSKSNADAAINGEKPTRNLEDLLAQPYFFHSRDFVNAHRYTVAGKYVKVEEYELSIYPTGYKLVVAYAVVSEEDEFKFSRSKGREVASKHLEDPTRSFEFLLTDEELKNPGKKFNALAREVAPLTVLFPDERHKVRRQFAELAKAIGESGEVLDKFVHNLRTGSHQDVLCMIEVEDLGCVNCDTHEYFLDAFNLGFYDREVKATKEQAQIEATDVTTQVSPQEDQVNLPQGDIEFVQETQDNPGEQAVS